MKKVLFILFAMVLGVSAMAQQKIQLRSVDKAECVKSDMMSLKASFSFSTIEAQDVENQRGTFSWLSMPNTVIGGNEGDPQIPIVNELIAVPFGATPRIEITSYSTTDYRLEDLGIHTLVPRQPSLRKDQNPEDVPFVYNESAYQTRGLRSAPTATVYVDGIMRGVQVGKMSFEPVSYDPVSNTLRVFNDIEVEVHFDGADAQATEEMLVKTYSPYFDIVYAQLFNDRMLRDVYSQHPDLYTTPVKMMVITTSTYANNSTFQSWVNWKKQKGIYTTVYTTSDTGTSSSNIKTFIRNKYNTDAPTFVVVVGDTGDVTYSLSSSTTSKVTDLYYSSTTDSDLYPEMFYSRMPVSSTTELANLLNKIMTYEKYTMADPSYLDETLLIAGWDSSWTSKVGKPTIQYANNYYFNSSNGIDAHVFLTTGTGQTTCYNYINQVGFVNYTAHGDNTMWYDPKFQVSNVNSMTNNDKYFWAMGNCCLAANWGYSSTCFAEALLRAANKGAFGYIGSCPETYWYEDYYFGVGATTTFSQMPTQSQTMTGCYDAMFDDTGFNTLNAVPFIGNLAVAYAYSGNYQTSISEKYYWEAYHCLGDGSVMPYHSNPSANNVSHASQLQIGATSFSVSAVAGSYVAITVNNEIIGVAQVPSNGTVNVPITAQTATGTAMIVVTRQQRQPYITTIPIQGGTQYTISATASPSNGGTVSGAGSYYSGTNCTLTATPNTGYTFTNWKKGNTVVSTEATYTFEVTGNASYTANFTAIPQYTITATANPTAGGTVNGGGTFYENTQCTLTATANTHYEFANWTKNGNVVSTNPTYTFTVTAAGAYTANFTALQQHTVTCAAVENGTISANPTMAYKNETVTLTATPASGYFFGGWNVTAGNQTITVTDNQFTMPDSDVTVSATFVQGYNVTLASVMNGSISATPTNCAPGTTVNLTATPASGYTLNCWVVYKTGDVNTTVTLNGNSFTMPSYDVTVSAIFSLPQGGDVIIGGDNYVTNNGGYFPTNVWYKYSLTQQIYTAAEVGDAGNITAISFYYTGSTSSGARTVEVYLSHTSNSTISSWLTQSSSDKVYSGSVTFTQGWNTITLNTPFAYNGTSNLLLTFDDNTGGYDVSSTQSFYTYSTGANRAIRYCSDSNNLSATSSNSTSGTTSKYNSYIKITKEVAGTGDYLSVSPDDMSGFTYAQGEGPSTSQVVTVVGCVADNITVTAPTDFEISDEVNGTYGSSLTLTASRGNRETLTYDFEDGWQNWTTFQGSTTSPNSWMHNLEYPTSNNNFSSGYGYNSSDGFMLSESYISGSSSGSGTAVTPDNYLVSPQVTLGGSITFQAGVQNVSYCAEKFSVMVSTTGNTNASDFTTVQTWTYSPNASSGSEWQEFTVDLSAYSGTGYIAIRHFDCYDQWILKIDDVTIVEGGDTPVNPTNPTTEMLTANVYVRLKGGLSQGIYANETLTFSSGSLNSNVSLNGEVTQGENPTQDMTVTLPAGWTWWSTYLDITLEQLEQALGTAGIIITSHGDGYVGNYSGSWSGNLQSITPSKMYKIQLEEEATITLSGVPVTPANCPITLYNSSNWIGYPVTQSMSLNEAFAGANPVNGDVVIAYNGSAMYYNGAWYGSLQTLEPGCGYIYKSNASGTKTFTYPSAE